MSENKTEYISHCFMGQAVKLSPMGKVYTLHTIVRADSRHSEHGKYSLAIEVIDRAGNTRQVSWGRRVYIVSEK